MPSKSPFELKPKYANFKAVEASRPDLDPHAPITFSKTVNPNWKYGDGAPLPPADNENSSSDNTAQFPEPKNRHVEIDPYAPGRPMLSNYKLLVSGVPRPISLVSTVSSEGNWNLAPFSYFQVVDHDPPTFVIGFSARPGRPKDTRRNLVETGECVISVVSEHMLHAVNATSLDIPHAKSEWELAGFTPAPSTTVKPDRVREAVFSIEGRLMEMKELDYHGKVKEGKPVGALAIIEATRFWVREDALSENQDEVELEKMRPLVQLGGMQYARTRETFELPRPSLQRELADESLGLKKFIDSDA